MTEEDNKKLVRLYTDGACSGNPGPGGWAAILKFGPHQKEISGNMSHTTNNRMELFAVISGLGALKQSNIRWVVEADYIIISDKEECPPCGRSLLI